MRRLVETVLTVVLLAAQPLSAQVLETDEPLGIDQLTVRPLTDEADAGAWARVVTDRGRPAECLAPLAVTRIDGQSMTVSAKGFLIAPGVHTLNGTATLDLGDCPLSDPRLTIASAPDLEVEFEAGNTYYIGYSYPTGKPDEWTLVMWNVESLPVVESTGFTVQPRQ